MRLVRLVLMHFCIGSHLNTGREHLCESQPVPSRGSEQWRAQAEVSIAVHLPPSLGLMRLQGIRSFGSPFNSATLRHAAPTASSSPVCGSAPSTLINRPLSGTISARQR